MLYKNEYDGRCKMTNQSDHTSAKRHRYPRRLSGLIRAKIHAPATTKRRVEL